MNKKPILIVSLVTLLVTVACGFSFQVPRIFSDESPQPTAEIAEYATEEAARPSLEDMPVVATPGSLSDLSSLNLADRDVLLTTLYERVSPGVVSLVVGNELGGNTGSGFVFDRQGHIVTNYHVVEGATSVEVDFLFGLKVRGEVIGTDLDSDLAVVKVDVPEDVLVPLPLGDSDQLRVGQSVIAIGNPFRLSGTMTVGIVSAKGRTLESMRLAEGGNFFTAGDIIQTDAAINPGNSGGPLLNLNGEVIGVNRAIRTTGATVTGDPVNSGIGFAISSNIVRRVVPALIAEGRYDYPFLGITSREGLTLEMIEELELPRQNGAYVISVTPGGPADDAGVRAGNQPTSFPGLPAGGDLIVAVDGQPVMTFGDMLSYLIKNKSPGDQVTLTILRDNTEMEVTITLGKRP
ncbi:MAG: trypsin-like peptidase domain-containing protein [Chloroflexota bacterium]